MEELRRYKQRMGWRFPWVSSLGSDFKYDFGAAFTDEQQRSGAEYNFRHTDDPGQQAPGMSAFALADGVVYHTYSTYARGVEQLMGTYRFLDLAPLGRNEGDSPAGWLRRHDEYDRPAEYNAKIINEFRANQGRVGGVWEETPLLLLHHAGAKSRLSRDCPHTPRANVLRNGWLKLGPRNDERVPAWACVVRELDRKHPSGRRCQTLRPDPTIEIEPA